MTRFQPTKLDRSVVKYLTQHAHNTSMVAEEVCVQVEHGVMIPAFAEGPLLVPVLRSIGAPTGGVLIVLVINRPPDPSALQVERQDAGLAAVRAAWPMERRLSAETTLHAWPAGALLLTEVVVPRRRGVGLARKIGCDLLLRLWANGAIKRPWLHMGDADAYWPTDFLNRVGGTAWREAGRGGDDGHGKKRVAAMLRTFSHDAAAQPHAEDCLRYEVRLRHHVLGLRWAGSSYGYQAIGSTISCHAVAYAQVRGVPPRPAAEDFYLLNKLAKVGHIRTLPGAPMVLSGRESDRVPFGTGAALRAAVATSSSPLCYDPRLFIRLRQVLSDVVEAVTHQTALPQATAALIADSPLQAWVATLLTSALSTGTRLRRLHDQFDAFATLKLMHAWRSAGLPDVTVEAAIAASPFCRDAGIALAMERENADFPALQTLLHRLDDLERSFDRAL